jgi:hypothetical protein
MMRMRAVAEVAVSVAVEAVFMAAVSAAAACTPAAFTAALEGFMAAAIAMQEVYGPHIPSQVAR